MNNLSQECRNQIEMLSAEKYPHDIDGQYYFDEGAKEALTNPTIYQSAGLMTVDEALMFAEWHLETFEYTQERGWQNKYIVTGATELLTIFRNQNQ